MSSKNLIYNRLDLIYEDSDYLDIDENDNTGRVYYHIENGIANINVWARCISCETFYIVIDKIFMIDDVYSINVQGSYNNYHDYLEQINDMVIVLPEKQEELICRLSTKTLGSIKRKEKKILERCKELRFVRYEGNIPNNLVDRFFGWKNETHGTDYGMTASEYLFNYHVTDAVEMKVDDKSVAVVFINVLEDTAYLENLSYDLEWGKYSPGFLTYIDILKWLVERRVKYFFLGKEGPDYKRHFDAIIHEAFWGYIYNKRNIEEVNCFLRVNDIHKIAIYGMGNVGKEFLRYSKDIDVDVLYGIDRSGVQSHGMQVKKIDEDLPDCDAVLITMDGRNEKVEKNLQSRGMKYYYWRELIRGGLM